MNNSPALAMLANIKRYVVLALMLCLLHPEAEAYSVLTHEEIVDLLWEPSLKPLLLEKYPGTTPEQLKEAHAYAYGGCVIQDMGYYPFGNRRFSDLLHYTRSGDFVVRLLTDAQDVNDYAFALGALAHYVADIDGHPAVNRSVPIEFPRLRHRYGNLITYEESPHAHIRTEFGFDVVQIAKHRYASEAYHDFIGFKVATPLLEKAFRETYGVDIRTLMPNLERSIGSYRHSVSKLIPTLTAAALLIKGNFNVPEKKDRAERRFVYRLSKAEYQKEWGNNYYRPNAGARILAALYWIVPKVGPLKVIAFKAPSTFTEDLYLKSIDTTLHDYQGDLTQAKTSTLALAGFNLDTGLRTLPGQYKLADRAYANLVHRLAQQHFQGLTLELKNDIQAFYSDHNASIEMRRHERKWRRLQAEVAQLRDAPVGKEASASGAQ